MIHGEQDFQEQETRQRYSQFKSMVEITRPKAIFSNSKLQVQTHDSRLTTHIMLASTAFCTCKRFSASSIAAFRLPSSTPSVTTTLRRTGRQCMKRPLSVVPIRSS